MKRARNNGDEPGLMPLILACVLIWLATRGGVTPEPVPPGPTPGPTPVVDEAPFPADRLSVLMVEDFNKRFDLPSSQIDLLNSMILRDRVRQMGGEIRSFDKDINAQHEAQKWRDGLAKPRDSLPWILIANGRRGYSGPLPKTVDEAIQLIERFK